MGGNKLMCDICKQTNCPPLCPNYECHKVGNCEKCGEELYKEYEIWTDDDGNKFCSQNCAKEFYGIKEIYIES